MRIRRPILLSLLALLLLLVAALLTLASRPEPLRWGLEQAASATGGRLQVDSVRGSLLGGVDIGELRWLPAPDAPGIGLRLQDVHAAWRPWSLLRGEIDLAQLRAASVELQLAPSAETPASPPPTSFALPLSLRLRALDIDEIRILPVDGAPIVLDAIALQARYGGGRYTIERLEAGSPWGSAQVSGTLADSAPFETDFQAALALRLGEAVLPVAATAGGSLQALEVDAQLAVEAGGSARARALIEAFDAQPLRRVALLLEALDLGALGLDGLPRTRLDGRVEIAAPERLSPSSDVDGRAAGTASAPASGGAPATSTLPQTADAPLVLQGHLALDNAVTATIDEGGLPLQRLVADLRWNAVDGLTVHGLEALLPGSGRIAGAFQVDPARGLVLPGLRLPWVAADLDIAGVDLSALSRAAPASALSGRIEGDGEAFAVLLRDRQRGGLAADVRGGWADGRLTLQRSTLDLGTAGAGARLWLAGTLEGPTALTLALEGGVEALDPARLPALAEMLLPQDAEAVAGLAWLERFQGRINGRWALSGTLPASPGAPSSGSVQAADAASAPIAPAAVPGALQLRLDIERSRLAGLPLRLRSALTVDQLQPGPALLERLRLRVQALDLALGDTRLEAEGALGAPDDRLRLNLQVPRLAQLDALAGGMGLTGAAALEGLVLGGLTQPGVDLKLRGDRLALGDTAQIGALTLAVQVPPAASSARTAEVSLRLAAQALRVGEQTVSELEVDGDGSVRAHRLQARAHTAQGRLQLALAGSLAEDGAWAGSVDRLSLEGPVPARLVAPVRVAVAPQDQGIGVTVGAATLEGGFGAVRVAQAVWREGRMALQADARFTKLGSTAAALGLSVGPSVPLADLDALVLRLEADLSGATPETLSGRAQLRIDSPPGGLGGGSADLSLRAGALDGPIALDLPTLAVASRLMGPEWSIDGRLRFDGQVAGTINAPRLTGAVTGSDLRLHQLAMGWRLRDGTLAGRFDGERFQLQSMKLYSGPAPDAGSVALSGEVRVADLEGRFDLVADRFAVLIGPGQRVVVSGQAQATSSGGAFEVKGKLRADEGRIEIAGGDAPTLPADVVVLDPRQSDLQQAAVPAQDGGFSIASDISIDLGDQLRVHGIGIDARLAGSLNLRGALPQAPRAFGTVRIREGRYRAYGQELQITRGLVVFNGPIDNPQLDIIALRREQAVEAGVAVTGTALSPQVRLTSRPEVPDAEKLSWLVLGVPLEDARAGGQSAALAAAAATLFGSNDGSLAGGLVDALGLDVLTIRSAGVGDGLLSSSFGGGGVGGSMPPVPGAVGTAASGAGAGAAGNVLAVGKRLSRNLLVTYEQGLQGVSNLLRIQYDITRRLSLRAQTGTESAVDLLYWFTYD